MKQSRSREKRWIVLTEDGRHVTLGCHSDPTKEELGDAANGLTASSLGGWLALTEGVYYSRGTMNIILVRELAPAKKITFEDAAKVFLAKRKATVSSYQADDSPRPG